MTNLNIRIDKELKEQAEVFFNELGLNMTTAFNIFVRQSLRQEEYLTHTRFVGHR